MGRTKVKIVFESDVYTPMHIIDFIFRELAIKKNQAVTPIPLRIDPFIEVTDYETLDWVGRESTPTTNEGVKE